MNNEIWKDIVGFEGLYQISSFGVVKSLGKWRGAKYSCFISERIMKPTISETENGYSHINLCKNGIKSGRWVHRLVAIHFIPNPENKPEVNHIDGDVSNNNVSNLEWATRLENEQHAWRIGLKTNKNELNDRSKPVIQYELTGEQIREWPSLSEIQRTLGFSTSHISKCCKGRLKKIYGYKWEYKKTG